MGGKRTGVVLARVPDTQLVSRSGLQRAPSKAVIMELLLAIDIHCEHPLGLSVMQAYLKHPAGSVPDCHSKAHLIIK